MGCASSAPSSASRRKKIQQRKERLKNGYGDSSVANIFDEAGNAVREVEEGVISFSEPTNFKALSDSEDYMKARILDPTRKTNYKFLDKSTTWSPDAGDYLEQKIIRDKHRFETKVIKEEVAPPPPVEKVTAKKTKKERIRSMKKAVKTKKTGLVSEGDASIPKDQTTSADERVNDDNNAMELDSKKTVEGEPSNVAEAGSTENAKPPQTKVALNLDNVLETLLKMEEEKEKLEEKEKQEEKQEEKEKREEKEKQEEKKRESEATVESEVKEDQGDNMKIEDTLQTDQTETKDMAEDEIAGHENDDDELDDTTDITQSSVSTEDVTTIAEDSSEVRAANETVSAEVFPSTSATESKGQETVDAPNIDASANNETHGGA